MTPTIERLPALRLVGLRCFGRRDELAGRVAPAWRELRARAAEIVGRVDPGVWYGITPESHRGPGPADGVHVYWCCIRIAANAPFPKGLGQLLIPAGPYAKGSRDGMTTAPERWALERIDDTGAIIDELRPIVE